ncbi:hypothetical protein T439DRAFT_129565 [Meredithblackwellia eburnea MCA 4105]
MTMGGRFTKEETYTLILNRSSTLFHTLVAIGARWLLRPSTLQLALDEVDRSMSLAKRTSMSDEQIIWELKALVLNVTHFGRLDLLPKMADLASATRLSHAVRDLLEIGPDAPEEEAAKLAEKGRFWHLIWTCETLFSSINGTIGPSLAASRRITEETSLLRTSKFCKPQIDTIVACFAENLDIVVRAQEYFDPVNRRVLEKQGVFALTATAEGFMAEMDDWWERWGTWLDAATKQLSDHPRSRIPLHNGRFTVLSFVFQVTPSRKELDEDPALLSLFKEAIIEGTMTLSVVGQTKLWYAYAPFAVHFQTVVLPRLPDRLCEFALLLPSIDIKPIVRSLDILASIMEQFVSSPSISTIEQEDQAKHLRTLSSRLRASRRGQLDNSSAASPTGETEIDEMMGEMDISIDGIIQSIYADAVSVRPDVTMWNEILTNLIV